MSPSPGPDELYRTSMSAAVGDRLVEEFDKAAADGRGTLFLQSLRHIDQRLRTDPVNFGEELFDLRTQPITVMMAIRLPVAVEFGVYRDKRIVLIRSFQYLPVAN